MACNVRACVCRIEKDGRRYVGLEIHLGVKAKNEGAEEITYWKEWKMRLIVRYYRGNRSLRGWLLLMGLLVARTQPKDCVRERERNNK